MFIRYTFIYTVLNERFEIYNTKHLAPTYIMKITQHDVSINRVDCMPSSCRKIRIN